MTRVNIATGDSIFSRGLAAAPAIIKIDTEGFELDVLILDAAKKYPNDREALMRMFRVLNGNTFRTPEALRAVFPSLDNFKYKDRWWVLDVGGNILRILAFIQFVNSRIYIKDIVNHTDYDKLTRKYRKAEDKKQR